MFNTEITEYIEFSQDKGDEVLLVGILSIRKRTLQLEDVFWDYTLYTTEQNAIIGVVADKNRTAERFFAACKEEARAKRASAETDTAIKI